MRRGASPRALRQAEIRKALQEGREVAFTSVRHALSQLEARNAAEQVGNSRTGRHRGASILRVCESKPFVSFRCLDQASQSDMPGLTRPGTHASSSAHLAAQATSSFLQFSFAGSWRSRAFRASYSPFTLAYSATSSGSRGSRSLCGSTTTPLGRDGSAG
jgi:hypothetical protein